MRFFSGKGDDGKSSILGGKRIDKNAPVFELLGTLDELSASLGMAISFCEDGQEIRADLRHIQEILSDLMGSVAGADVAEFDFAETLRWVEDRISYYGKGQEMPAQFVFPGRTSAGAALDLARTIARRAERSAVRYSKESGKIQPVFLKTQNRLSSLFFVMRLFLDKS